MLQLVVAGLTVGSAYALVALGMHIILRATRVVNFAQGEFVILGGLFALSFANLFHGNMWLALVAATLAGFALGVVFELAVLRPAARRDELAVAIATIGFSFILLYGHALLWGSLPEPLPPFSGTQAEAMTLGPIAVQVQSLWVLALLALAFAVLWWFSERTRFGKAIRAAAQNPTGARLVGINVAQARAISVGIAIALAAFGGTIIGPITLVGGAGGISIAIKGFVGAIIGGIDSPIGCAIGGLLVGVIGKLLEGRFGFGVADPIVYSLMLLALIMRPQGLFGARGALRD